MSYNDLFTATESDVIISHQQGFALCLVKLVKLFNKKTALQNQGETFGRTYKGRDWDELWEMVGLIILVVDPQLTKWHVLFFF